MKTKLIVESALQFQARGLINNTSTFSISILLVLNTDNPKHSLTYSDVFNVPLVHCRYQMRQTTGCKYLSFIACHHTHAATLSSQSVSLMLLFTNTSTSSLSLKSDGCPLSGVSEWTRGP